jgi:hypothetical protein
LLASLLTIFVTPLPASLWRLARTSRRSSLMLGHASAAMTLDVYAGSLVTTSTW